LFRTTASEIKALFSPPIILLTLFLLFIRSKEMHLINKIKMSKRLSGNLEEFPTQSCHPNIKSHKNPNM
jgi:hypothetical protein